MIEVKVRQMPPKPFRDSAKKMSADNTANKEKIDQEMAFNLEANDNALKRDKETEIK